MASDCADALGLLVARVPLQAIGALPGDIAIVAEQSNTLYIVTEDGSNTILMTENS